VGSAPGPASGQPLSGAVFVGSASCRSCHQKEYDGWKQTRMANVVRDPREHPDAVLGDFTSSKPGVTDFYQFADLTAHKNRMQGNDFVQSTMYHRGLRCFDCHQVHSNKYQSNLGQSGNALCLTCHNNQNPAGLRVSVSRHTHHAENSPGSQCVACHMPAIEQTNKDNYVAAHTFRFITPTQTDETGIPNPCTSCHKDKTNAWATKALRSWDTTSPWRVAN